MFIKSAVTFYSDILATTISAFSTQGFLCCFFWGALDAHVDPVFQITPQLIPSSICQPSTEVTVLSEQNEQSRAACQLTQRLHLQTSLTGLYWISMSSFNPMHQPHSPKHISHLFQCTNHKKNNVRYPTFWPPEAPQRGQKSFRIMTNKSLELVCFQELVSIMTVLRYSLLDFPYGQK